jgi:hypothetical protein
MRLVLNRIATLEEIERWWSLEEVLRYNEALDALEEAAEPQ